MLSKNGYGRFRVGPRSSMFLAIFLCLACESTEGSQSARSGGGETDNPATSAMREKVLRSIAENVYGATYSTFAEKTSVLVDATLAWREELTDENHQVAQDAWRDANAVWQRLEVMQVGPAGTAGRRVGGEDLRDVIYSFPMSNPCRIDQELEAERYLDDGWADRAQFNVRGLDALEYLLFFTQSANSCPESVSLNRQGQWNQLVDMGTTTLQSRRASFAHVLAMSLSQSAEALAETWATDGTFTANFVQGAEPYESPKQALDQVYAGLFYLDKFVKDLKLGKPAGITPDCDAETCPDSVESKFATVSKENLVNNLRGLKMVFTGGPDDSFDGFDDLLIAEGSDSLAVTLMAKIEAAIESVEAIEGSLAEAIRQNDGQVTVAYEAVKTLNDDFKTEFVTVLNLSVPQEGAGDND